MSMVMMGAHLMMQATLTAFEFNTWEKKLKTKKQKVHKKQIHYNN